MADLRRCIFDSFDNVTKIRKNMTTYGLGNVYCLTGINWKMEELKDLGTPDLYDKAKKILKVFISKEVTNNEQ